MTNEERWERDLPELIESIFPPRIALALIELNIKVDPKDVELVINRKQGFYLYGHTSTGKTLYGAQLVLEIAKYYRMNHLGTPSTIFISCLDLLERIKDSFKEGSPSNNIMEKVKSANILMLDDIGAEKVSEWVLQTLNYLINERYENLRTTIITSNFDLDKLETNLGSRVVPRIYEMCEQKKFDEKNYRLEKGA
jgi:DNA replication protein DnaC